MDAPASPVASVADGVRRGLDPRHVTTERIASWIFTAGVCCGVVVGLLFVWIPGWLALGWCIAASSAGLALIGGLCCLAQFYPPLDHRRRSYVVSPAGVEICKGVLWRSVVSVARSRVQHTDVVQGPLQRRYRLATLIIYTAGTEHAAIDLAGLARETAIAIRDFLVREEAEAADKAPAPLAGPADPLAAPPIGGSAPAEAAT